jgi:hypothetical protein
MKTFDECKRIFEQPTEWSIGLSTPGKGHSGPCFVEAIDMPVKHIPGTFAIEPRAKKTNKQPKFPAPPLAQGLVAAISGREPIEACKADASRSRSSSTAVLLSFRKPDTPHRLQSRHRGAA